MIQQNSRTQTSEEIALTEASRPLLPSNYLIFRSLLSITGPYFLLLYAFSVLLLISASLLKNAIPFQIGKLANIQENGIQEAKNFAILVALFSVVKMLSTYSSKIVGQTLSFSLRENLFKIILSADFYFHQKNKSGELLSRIVHDSSYVNQLLTNQLFQAAEQIISLALSVIMLLYINWKAGALFILLTPLLAKGNAYLANKVTKLSKDYAECLASQTGHLKERLEGLETIKSFSNEKHQLQQFETYMTRTARAANSRALINTLMDIFSEGLPALSIFIAIYMGGSQVINNKFSIPELTSFILYANQYRKASSKTGQALSQLSQSVGSIAQVLEIITNRSESEQPRKQDFSQLLSEVNVVKVHCRYRNSESRVLSDVSLELRPGQFKGVVGDSGSGKSSLLKSIISLIEVQSGQILFNARRVQQISKEQLFRLVGYVTQNPFIFSGTVKDNVLYGSEQASESEFREACELAGLNALIDSLPLKEHTLINESGSNLSGGQRQRISIARVLIRKPNLLLLDQATSALDYQTQRCIMQTIRFLLARFKDRLMILAVAHRLQTIMQCDEVLVMQGGRVVERGTPAALSAREGLFMALLRNQDIKI